MKRINKTILMTMFLQIAVLSLAVCQHRLFLSVAMLTLFLMTTILCISRKN